MPISSVLPSFSRCITFERWLILLSVLLIAQNMSPSSVCAAVSVGRSAFEYDGFTNNRYPSFNPDENKTEKEQNLPVISEHSSTTVGNAEVIVGRVFKITVYPWNNHMGRPGDMEWEDNEVENRVCKPIPNGWQGKVKSIDTHNNCIVLFSRERCRGAFRVVKIGSPSHNRLSGVCFHKKSLSARPCTPEEMGMQSLKHISDE